MATGNTVYMGTDADGNDIGLRFSPDVLSVAAGTSVRWINNDEMDHTATSDAGSAENYQQKICKEYYKPGFACFSSFEG